jgi:N-methylhydantoinase A
LLLGIDIGGTYTDGVYIDKKGKPTVAKTLSTPQDGFVSGLFNCIQELARQVDLSPKELLKTLDRFTHGSTIATNIVLEGTGAKVGVITTKGHRDVLKDMLGKGKTTGRPVDDVYFVLLPKPEQVVPDELIIEVTERSDHKGAEIVKLNEEEVENAIRTLIDKGIESLAICFLWSFLNSAHEQRAKEIALKIKPDLFASCSCDVVPKLGEYQRFTATVLNSMVYPKSAAYINTITDRLKAEYDFDKQLQIMSCDGGILPWVELQNTPLYMIDSGPVGGMSVAEEVCAQVQEPNIVAIDMGGTSFDLGLIVNGISEIRDTSVIRQWEYAIPRYDIESIGAGGGSIAWCDEDIRAIRIGPKSAGAMPGPACYGRGGNEPTVSDASLLLGYLNPRIMIEGKKLNKEQAIKAIGKLGKKIGKDTEEMAIGIFELTNEIAGGEVRSALISRGLDYRKFVLLCYGGAGSLHMTEIAKVVGIKQCIVPPNSSVFSAIGLCVADVKVRSSKEVIYPEPWDAGTINSDFAEMEKQLLAKIRAAGASKESINIRRKLIMQFKGQFYQMRVPVTSGELTEENLAEAKEEFVNIYTSRYGRAALIPGATVTILSEESECIGKTPKVELLVRKESTQVPAKAVMRPRRIYAGKVTGFVEAEVFNGAELLAGNKIIGPAMIDFPHTSIRLGPGETGVFDKNFNFVVTVP